MRKGCVPLLYFIYIISHVITDTKIQQNNDRIEYDHIQNRGKSNSILFTFKHKTVQTQHALPILNVNAQTPIFLLLYGSAARAFLRFTKLTDPSPVTGSQPAVAVNPYGQQFGLGDPLSQLFSPLVISWKILAPWGEAAN